MKKNNSVVPVVGMKLEHSTQWDDIVVKEVNDKDKTYRLGFDGLSTLSSPWPFSTLVDLGNGRIIHNAEELSK